MLPEKSSNRNLAIEVLKLSKRYRIGLAEEKQETLALQLVHLVKAPIRNFLKLRSLGRFRSEDESVFWALKDIDFEVKKGEVLGIIGHNGAGKSTLLKILSRITEPTKGEIRIRGRVSSLLEVGTGFHPDLTGRENVYMNGTILGMTRKEIDRKFEEIHSFSGIGKYIDTPVKRYSSGMRVRLAFSVAAHLEPEILIIDEVLAVGDAEFQKKCLGKMEDVAGQGRTVLFVSHNMAAVERICSRAILLSSGKIVFEGSPAETINFYLSGGKAESKWGKIPSHYPRNSYHTGICKIESIELSQKSLRDGYRFRFGEKISFDLIVNSSEELGVIVTLSFIDQTNTPISFSASNEMNRQHLFDLVEGKNRINIEVDQTLLPGDYSIGLNIWDPNGYPYDSIQSFGSLSIEKFGKGGRGYPWGKNLGFVAFQIGIKNESYET